MAIQITVADIAKFSVKGTIKDAAGIDQPFDFKLTCRRLDADTLSARVKDDSGETFLEFLTDVVEDWSGVRNGDSPVPYSAAALAQLCKIPGIARTAWLAYLAETAVKAKN